MAIVSRNSVDRNVDREGSKSRSKAENLPAVLGKHDLVLLTILTVVLLPEIRGMQFAGPSIFFYLPLAFVTLMLPCIYITGWLMRQAPKNVPVYEWVSRLLDARWRSFVLFLTWWLGVLAVFSILGMGVCALQVAFPGLHGAVDLRCLAFAVLLILAMLIVCLPLRVCRIVLWICGLLYIGLFGLLGVTALVAFSRGQASGIVLPHKPTDLLPGLGSFSWLFYGISLLSLLGVNAPFLMDGEVRGSNHCIRGFPGSFWSGGLASFFLCFLGTIAMLTLSATAYRFPLQSIGRVFGPNIFVIACLLLVAGYFGVALSYLLLFSRALFRTARQGYLPRFLTCLNRFGVPLKTLLVQCGLIISGAFIVFVMVPLVFGGSMSGVLFSTIISDDQFNLLSSTAGALWAWLTALIFGFVLWLYFKRRVYKHGRYSERVLVPGLSILGCLTSLVCMTSPLVAGWPTLFFSHANWFSLVVLGIVSSLLLAWMVSELPRRSLLLREKEKRLAHEKELRGELQRVYRRECDLHNRLREAYDEQQVSILQQKILLDDLNRLYREQELAAITDAVTGLPNHRAFIKRLDEEIERCQNEIKHFLLLFVDLDHFKGINDTWGHLAGDAVLAEVSSRLQEAAQPEGFVGRYGGEEFALILPDVTLADAWEIAQRLRIAVNADPYTWRYAKEEMTGIFVTASIGVAAYGIHGKQREELIKRADQAMYQAKLEGRDCVHMAGVPASVHHSALMEPGSTQRRREHLQRLIGENEDMTLISVQAVQALAAVVHIRDHSTGSHSYRMISLAEETGRRMNLPCEDLFLIRLGALLHDIGKIGVPDTILRKPGPLNEEEWRVMRQHPMIGARILAEVDGYFQVLAQVVMSHHERWDGQGYPRGLKGQEIPLAARILSVADAYDAMISRRPYKEPMPVAAAEDELRRCAGTQFDPVVVEAFLSVPKTHEPGRVCVTADPHRVSFAPKHLEPVESQVTFRRSHATDESGLDGAGSAGP